MASERKRIAMALAVMASAGAPSALSAQLSRADSAAIVAVLAPRVRQMINSQAIMQDAVTLLRAGAPWNPLLQTALTALDSALIARTPTATTARFNVFTADVSSDSVVVNVGVTHCDGTRFAGSGNRFVLKRDGEAWRLVSTQFSGSGHGRCGQSRLR